MATGGKYARFDCQTNKIFALTRTVSNFTFNYVSLYNLLCEKALSPLASLSLSLCLSRLGHTAFCQKKHACQKRAQWLSPALPFRARRQFRAGRSIKSHSHRSATVDKRPGRAAAAAAQSTTDHCASAVCVRGWQAARTAG